MKRQIVRLSQIRLETSFRNEGRDESLELSLNKEGLRNPLLVEKKGENQYILVEGYRRYFALHFIGKKEAQCIVEEETSEEGRLLKRLDMEFHTEKRNAYQLERMINRLVELKNYGANDIARLCNVTEETVKKYLKGREVNPEWIERGERAGVGRHGLTEIHNLKCINVSTKEYIVDLYIDGKINGKTVGAIKDITGVPGFENISEEIKKDCIDDVIKLGIKDKEMISEIVSKKRLEKSYDEESHENITNLLTKLLNRSEKILRNNHYVNYLPLRIKLNFKKKLEGLIILLNIPKDLSDFDGEKENIKETKEDKGESNYVDNLEH